MSKLYKFFSTVIVSVLFITTAFAAVACNNDSPATNETVTVADMLGEKVTVKKNPRNVACVSRTTYDLLIAFGVADSIDGVYYSLLENEWSSVFDSKANERYALSYEESYETYISRGVDIVFAPEKYIADGLKEHGIKALNVSLYGNPDFSDYVYFFADLVKQIWDNEEVANRVDSWKEKMQTTITGIQTELAKHNDAKRTVYYYEAIRTKESDIRKVKARLRSMPIRFSE